MCVTTVNVSFFFLGPPHEASGEHASLEGIGGLLSQGTKNGITDFCLCTYRVGVGVCGLVVGMARKGGKGVDCHWPTNIVMGL